MTYYSLGYFKYPTGCVVSPGYKYQLPNYHNNALPALMKFNSIQSDAIIRCYFLAQGYRWIHGSYISAVFKKIQNRKNGDHNPEGDNLITGSFLKAEFIVDPRTNKHSKNSVKLTVSYDNHGVIVTRGSNTTTTNQSNTFGVTIKGSHIILKGTFSYQHVILLFSSSVLVICKADSIRTRRTYRQSFTFPKNRI